MTLTRKLALALCLVFSFITLSSNSQTTLDYTTGNIVLPTVQGSGTTPWTGGVYQDSLTCWYGGDPGYCGPNAIVRPGNNINFSYGSTYLYQQQQASNLVPANALNITGYNFSFTAKNGNGWDGGGTDTLSALVRFWDATGNKGAGNLLYGTSYNLSYNTQGWKDFNYNETLPTPLSAKLVGLVQYGFIGRDNNGWAGPYGPEIHSVNFSLKYSVDPCATNPAYSPNCSGFNTVATSNNLVSNPGGYAVFGSSVNQSYAINTALAAAGSAAQIHGFQWGYTANANGPYCAVWMLVCFDERTPKVQTHVSITDSNGGSLYSVSRNYENSYNNTNYSYLFPASKPMSTLGNFNFSATAYDSAYVGGMYSRALYTADPCAVNPLSSPTCSGYGAAFAKTLSTASTTTTTAPALAPLPPALAEAAPALAEAAPALASPTAQTAPPPAAPPPPVQDTAVAQSDPAQPSPTQAGPAPTGPPAPAGGPPQTATASASSSTSSGPSTSSAGPSKLAMSVLKTAQANDKATQTAAVQAAAKTLETATQSSQASSNMAISMNQDMSANSAVAAAQFASQTTQASQQTAIQSVQQQQVQQVQTQQTARVTQQVQQVQQDTQQVQAVTYGTSTQVQQAMYVPPVQQQQDTQTSTGSMLRPPTAFNVEVQQQASSGTGLTVSRNPFAYSPLSSVTSSNVAMLQPTAPTFQSRIDTRQLEVETPQVQVATFGGAGKAGNPLSDMMQQKFELMQDNISQSTSSVNRNVQPNDLAGKVDLAAMATVPAGFTAYSFVLRDAAFYEPKEVYKNQKTVDNVRILRGLTGGSDALHQRMVDSQYK